MASSPKAIKEITLELFMYSSIFSEINTKRSKPIEKPIAGHGLPPNSSTKESYLPPPQIVS